MTAMEQAYAALTAFGHHADDCEYALTVCTCGFTEALRVLFAHQVAGCTKDCRCRGKEYAANCQRDPGCPACDALRVTAP